MARKKTMLSMQRLRSKRKYAEQKPVVPLICKKKKVDSMMVHEWYQIRVKGHLGEQWRDWFDGLTITNGEQGEAILSGPLLDQAALHGVLTKIRDLGLPLLAVSRVATENAEKGQEAGE